MPKIFALLLSVTIISSACGIVGGSNQAEGPGVTAAPVPTQFLDFGNGCRLSTFDVLTWDYDTDMRAACLELGVILNEDGTLEEDVPVVTEESRTSPFVPVLEGQYMKKSSLQYAHPSGDMVFVTSSRIDKDKNKVDAVPPTIWDMNYYPTYKEIELAKLTDVEKVVVVAAAKPWIWSEPTVMAEHDILESADIVAGPERNAAGQRTTQILILSKYREIGIEDNKQIIILETFNMDSMEITNTVDLSVNYYDWLFRFQNDRLQGREIDWDAEATEEVDEEWFDIFVTSNGMIAKRIEIQSTQDAAFSNYSELITLEILTDEISGRRIVFGYPPNTDVEAVTTKDASWSLNSSGDLFEMNNELWGVISTHIAKIDPATGQQVKIVRVLESDETESSAAPKESIIKAWGTDNWITYTVEGVLMSVHK